jgi:hypothetical protein
MSAVQTEVRSGVRGWVLTGVVTGVVAGIVFAMFEMVVAGVMGQGFFAPLRMIGATALGEGALRDNRGALIGAATVFGLVLWLVNFYVIAPVLFPWFLMSPPPVQFLAHTIFFGTALGLLIASRTGREG